MSRNLPILPAKASRNNLPVLSSTPQISVDSLQNLQSFLASKKTEIGFPSISVLPDFLGSLLSFVNARKQMKLDEARFQAGLTFAYNMVDRQLAVSIQKLNCETQIQLAAIRENVQVQLRQIDLHYNEEIKRIEREYNLKRTEMENYYNMLERYRKDQNKRFAVLLQEIQCQRGEIRAATHEIALVSKHLQKKWINDLASPEEMQYYLLLMQLRLDSINSMEEAICIIASKVN